MGAYATVGRLDAATAEKPNVRPIDQLANVPPFWYDLRILSEREHWIVTPVRIVRYIALQRRQRRRARERTGPSQLLRLAGVLLLAVFLVTVGAVASGVSAAAGVYAYFTRDLPEPEQIEAAEENFETTKIYDHTGPTIGGTAPALTLPVPASTTKTFEFRQYDADGNYEGGIQFENGVSYACVSDGGGTAGTTAPASTVQCFWTFNKY